MKRPWVPVAVLAIAAAASSMVGATAFSASQVSRRVAAALAASTRVPCGARGVALDAAGNVVVEGLWIGPEPAFRASRLVLVRRPFAALMGRLVVRRVEVEGARIVLPPDGRLPGAEREWFRRHAGAWGTAMFSVSDLTVVVGGEEWHVTGLTGRPDLAGGLTIEGEAEGPLGGKGRLMGLWNPTTGTVRGRLRIDGQPLAGRAVSRVSPALSAVWESMAPEGPVDLVLDFEATPGAPVVTEWSAEAFDLAMRPPGIGLAFDRVEGRAVPGHAGDVQFEGVRGRVQGGEVALVGGEADRAGPDGWRVALQSGPLGPAAFMNVLDPAWQRVWALVRPGGAAAFDLALSGGSSRTIRAEGEARCDGLSMALGTYQWRVDGKALVLLNGEDGLLAGDIRSDRLVAGGLDLAGFSARLKANKTGFVLEDARADVAGGHVHGRIVAIAGETASVEADLDLKGIDCRALPAQFAPYSANGMARFDGHVRIQWPGPGGVPQDGRLVAAFSGGEWDPQIYRAVLAEVARRTPADQVLRAGHADVRFSGDTAVVERLFLVADRLALSGIGTIGRDGGLDLVFAALIGGSVADLYAGRTVGNESLVRIRVAGSLGAPDVTTGPANDEFVRRLAEFFPEEGRTAFVAAREKEGH